MNPPPDPSTPGPSLFDRIVYAASGLNYGADPSLAQYTIFDAPSPDFVTRRVDLSSFADLGAFMAWPFSNTDVPLNGELRLPRGEGPFPLALFAHGNHDPEENSTPGYLYLCELLASHGVAAATIDVNFLNGSNFGENDGRAIVQLEHVRQFATWNARPGHPLEGKVDLERVMLVGHSRGGEAVGHASLFNRETSVRPDPGSPPVKLDGSEGLGPYQFPLRALVAIAPTDGQYVPVAGPTRVLDNDLVIHGSRDNDVFSFPGQKTLDRSHPLDPSDPLKAPEGAKSLLWVHKANHNFFNSVWAQESFDPTLARAEQEGIAKVYVGAVALAELVGRTEYRETLRDHRFALTAGWLPVGTTFVSQHQPTHRQFLQHFEEAGAAIEASAPTLGSVSVVGATALKLRFALGSSSHLNQETSGLRLDWTGPSTHYALDLDSASFRACDYEHLALRVGQSFEPNNPSGARQDFTLVFEDDYALFALTVGELQDLAFPDVFPGLRSAPKTVMQTVRVPLDRLRKGGLDPERLRRVSLRFDQTSSGTIYLDDVQFSS